MDINLNREFTAQVKTQHGTMQKPNLKSLTSLEQHLILQAGICPFIRGWHPVPKRRGLGTHMQGTLGPDLVVLQQLALLPSGPKE